MQLKSSLFPMTVRGVGCKEGVDGVGEGKQICAHHSMERN